MKIIKNILAGAALAATAFMASSVIAEPAKTSEVYAAIDAQHTTMTFIPASFEKNGTNVTGWYVLFDALNRTLSYGLVEYHCAGSTARLVRLDVVSAEGTTQAVPNQIIQVKANSNLDVAKKLSCAQVSPTNLGVLLLN